MDPAIIAGVDLAPVATTPSIAGPVKSMMELILTSQQPEVPRVSAINKGKGTYIPSPNKKVVPPTKPKGTIIGDHVAPAPFISEEEEGYVLGGEDALRPPMYL